MSPKQVDPTGSSTRTFGLGPLAGVALIALLVGVVIGSSVGGGGSPAASPVSPRPRPDVVAPQQLGATVTTSVGNQITVSSFESGVDLSAAPPKNKVFAKVEAKWCASVSQATTPVDNLVLLFVLEMPDGSRVAAEPQAYSSHDLAATTAGSVAPGGCVKGWVVFAVPAGQTPSYVDFNGVGTFRWAIPSSSSSPSP